MMLLEAATHRGMLLRFFRDAQSLVEDRTLPEAIRKEIQDVRDLFRQTWADIEAAAAKEAPAAEFAEVIKQDGDEWVVLSEEGKELGRYKTKAEAVERLRQIEYYKVHGEQDSGGDMDPNKKLAEAPEDILPPGEEPKPEGEKKPKEQPIVDAFTTQFDKKGSKRGYAYWVLYASDDPQGFGQGVVVQKAEGQGAFFVPFIKTSEKDIAFAQESEWVPLEVTYNKPSASPAVGNAAPTPAQPAQPMPAEPTAPEAAPQALPPQSAMPTYSNIAESESGAAVEIAEDGDPGQGGGPLVMRVKLIEPGWGNGKDNHWYGADMLKRDAHAFIGSKMFESDHGKDKTTRNWVSTVRGISGYTDSGAPVAEVVVHDPGFAQRVRNLKAAGMLGHLPCSILASGEVSVGEVSGRKANIVNRIVEAQAVDWVTKAGAGGAAVDIAELGVTTEQVRERVKAVHPAVAERVSGGHYATLSELESAIDHEVAYVKRVTGSGAPTGMGDKAAAPKPASIAERETAILKKYGVMTQ